MGLVSFTTFGRHYGLAKDDDNIVKNTIIHPARSMTKPQQMGPTNCGPHIGSTEYHHIIHRVSLEGTFVKSAWIRNSLWAPVSFYELEFRRRFDKDWIGEWNFFLEIRILIKNVKA